MRAQKHLACRERFCFVDYRWREGRKGGRGRSVDAQEGERVDASEREKSEDIELQHTHTHTPAHTHARWPIAEMKCSPRGRRRIFSGAAKTWRPIWHFL